MYRRRYYRGKGSKYSNETINFGFKQESNISAAQSMPETQSQSVVTDRGFTIVPPSDVMGSRKIKNIRIRITSHGNASPLFGVLVYAPQGTVPSALTVGGTNTNRTYEPNQNVISSFMLPAQISRDSEGAIASINDQQIITISSRLARILNSGDTIKLIVASSEAINASSEEPFIVEGTANYVIKY